MSLAIAVGEVDIVDFHIVTDEIDSRTGIQCACLGRRLAARNSDLVVRISGRAKKFIIIIILQLMSSTFIVFGGDLTWKYNRKLSNPPHISR